MQVSVWSDYSRFRNHLQLRHFLSPLNDKNIHAGSKLVDMGKNSHTRDMYCIRSPKRYVPTTDSPEPLMEILDLLCPWVCCSSLLLSVNENKKRGKYKIKKVLCNLNF